MELRNDARDATTVLPGEARRHLEEGRAILEPAATVRPVVNGREEALRRWELRIELDPPRGRRARQVVAECREAAAAATRLHRAVRDRELRALPHLEAALADLKRGAEEEFLPARLVDEMEASLRHRTAFLDELESLLELSGRIDSVRPRTGPEVIRVLLEERRHHVERANRARAMAEEAERRAFPEPEDEAPEDEWDDLVRSLG